MAGWLALRVVIQRKTTSRYKHTFSVTKPVVISRCDCIMRLAACMCLMLLEARLQLAVNALKLQARSGSMLFLPVQPGGWICTQLKEVVVAYLSQALVVHDKIRPAG